MRAVLLAFLPACFGTSPASRPVPTAPTVVPAPPLVFPALARADLVAELDDNELAAYAIAGDRLVELGRIRLAPPRGDDDYPADTALAWIDRDRVLVQAGDVFVVSTAGIEKLAVPSDNRFDGVPQPKSTDENMTRGHGGRPIAHAGKAYWNHCTWGLPYDGFQCEDYAQIQIWPTSAAQRVEDADAPANETSIHWRDAPAGFALGTTDKEVPTCKLAGADVVLSKPRTSDDDDASLVGGTHWLPGSPPALLVEYGGFGLTYYAESFAVFDRCSETPAIRGSSYVLFADGLWTAQELTTIDPPAYTSRLRRGLAVLGDLPPSSHVAIRPR